MTQEELQKSLRDKLSSISESSAAFDEPKTSSNPMQDHSQSMHIAPKAYTQSESKHSNEEPAPEKTPQESIAKQQERHPNPQHIFSWEAPARAYKRKSKGVLRFYAAIAVLLSLLVIFFRDFILVVPIWAIMFLVYALTVTPPPTVKHSITQYGFLISNIAYSWDSLAYFYFIKKFDYTVLVLLQANQYAQPLYLVIPDTATQEALLEILSKNLMYQENPQKNLTDRLAEWLTSLMPEDGVVAS